VVGLAVVMGFAALLGVGALMARADDAIDWKPYVTKLREQRDVALSRAADLEANLAVIGDRSVQREKEWADYSRPLWEAK